MGRKTFVIDTNVLLHDPDAIVEFADNDVVIPLTVIEELDRMKRQSDELGRNARQVIRFIDSLKARKQGNLHSGIPIENGITFKFFIESKFNVSQNFPFPL